MPTLYERDPEPGGHTEALTPPTPLNREPAPDAFPPRDPVTGEVLPPDPYDDPDLPADPVERQHDAYGGLKAGAALFGWLSAQSLGALLAAAAAGAASVLGVTSALESRAEDDPQTALLAVGALALALVALTAYAGGYVAGRMARFDGGRQGVAVWVLGVLTAGAVGGSVVLLGFDPPVPTALDGVTAAVDGGRTRLVAAGVLAAVVLTALGAAVGGGKVGVRYHRKVDLAGEDIWDDRP
jgi:hypothetical protein